MVLGGGTLEPAGACQSHVFTMASCGPPPHIFDHGRDIRYCFAFLGTAFGFGILAASETLEGVKFVRSTAEVGMEAMILGATGAASCGS
jgi:hypothetical protein